MGKRYIYEVLYQFETEDKLTFDESPTAGSRNPVRSGGVNSALQGKQDVLTFDESPQSGSRNPVRSSGIYTALQGKQDTEDDLLPQDFEKTREFKEHLGREGYEFSKEFIKKYRRYYQI